MSNLLYYPYINLPKTNWTIRALLYYDNISSIAPNQYFHEPEQYEPFMREVIQSELITPINPMTVLENPWKVSKIFIDYLNMEIKLHRFIEKNSHLGKIALNYMLINLMMKYSTILFIWD